MAFLSRRLAQRQMERWAAGSSRSRGRRQGLRRLAPAGDRPRWHRLQSLPRDRRRPARKLNAEPLRDATNFVDGGANRRSPRLFRPSGQDGREVNASAPVPPPGRRPGAALYLDPAADPPRPHPERCLGRRPRRRRRVRDRAQTGDEGRDNSQAGRPGETKLEAYRLDGRFLWRINLGKNIREGAHYTQFLVYDLDGDGKAEVVCKTADGTVDGPGDHRRRRRRLPQRLRLHPRRPGVPHRLRRRDRPALATTEYLPPRGKAADWGDDPATGSTASCGVAYLDGSRPSVIMCRGYYTRTVLAAWNWRDGSLSKVWTFDSDDGTPGNRSYRGQGNHNLRVGDVDGDGNDEIVYGACVIDDDGKGLYSTGLGHGDALHLSDIDPDRPGLEVFDIHETPRHPNGAEFRDARTGKLIWGKPSPDVGRGVAIDIDPRHRGYEMWASGQGLAGLWNVKGETISDRKPRSCNFGVWWDGDLLREILDGNRISKWNWRERHRDQPALAPRLPVQQLDQIDPLPLRRHPRRLEGRSHLEDARQQGAANLHDHDPDDHRLFYPDARPALPAVRGLPERRLQPADAARLLPGRRHVAAAPARDRDEGFETRPMTLSSSREAAPLLKNLGGTAR